MHLAGLGELFAMLYTDKMNVYRPQETEDDDFTASIDYLPNPTQTNVPCRISFSSDDTGTDSEVDRHPVVYNPKLFCRSDVDLKAGDYVVVKRYTDKGVLARTYEGTLSEPSWYPTHQEVFVRVNKGA